MSHINTICLSPDYCFAKHKSAAHSDGIITIFSCDLLAHMKECGENLDDDWKPDRQRVEEIAAAREGRKPRKIR